jgi:hypothetical protein
MKHVNQVLRIALAAFSRLAIRNMKISLGLILSVLLTGTSLWAETVYVPESAVNLEYDLFTGKPRMRKSAGKDTTTVFREVRDGTFTARVLPLEGEHTCYFRKVEGDAQQYYDRAAKIFHKEAQSSRQSMPAELIGLPGLITTEGMAKIAFELSQPARIYAYIDWAKFKGKPAEQQAWKLYFRDVTDKFSLYFRDFPAGAVTLELKGARFIGTGLKPLAALSRHETLVVTPDIVNQRLQVRFSNVAEEERHLTLRAVFANPETGKDHQAALQEARVQGKSELVIPIKTTGITDGIFYTVKLEATEGPEHWQATIPFGNFPPEQVNSAVEVPFPFGAYIHLYVNHDNAIEEVFYRALLYKMRRLNMNCFVPPDSSKARWFLDLAKDYGMKCIIRANEKNPESLEVGRHPQLLNYMVGDEPKIDIDLDDNIKTYKELNRRYPELLPITSNVLNEYGHGTQADPVLIWNRMKDCRFTLSGRWYGFLKSDYGLLREHDYTFRYDAVSLFNSLEGYASESKNYKAKLTDAQRAALGNVSDGNWWWLVVPTFGQDKPDTYYRIPKAPEMNALLHLALAHGARGFVGWTSTEYSFWQTVLFSFPTLAPTPHSLQEPLKQFGEYLIKAGPTLKQFTHVRIGIYQYRPLEIHAAARWLADKRFCIYVVNLDPDKAHPLEFANVILGNPKGKVKGGEQLFDEIKEVKDVITGESIPFQKYVDATSNIFLRVSLSELAPGAARLLVVSAKSPSGSFTQIDKSILERLESGRSVEKEAETPK